MIEQTATRIAVVQTVPVPAARLFAVLADPARHTEIDGSGMLQGDASNDVITEVGQAFTMGMHYPSLGDYRTVNTIVAFEPDRVIGWATAREGNPPAGVRWTWELEPVVDGDHPDGHHPDARHPDASTDVRTKVTHTYDWSRVSDPAVLARVSFPRVQPEQLQQTVRALVDAAAEPA